MLGRALITAAAVAVWLLLPRQPLEGARKTRNGPEPCAFVVTN